MGTQHRCDTIYKLHRYHTSRFKVLLKIIFVFEKISMCHCHIGYGCRELYMEIAFYYFYPEKQMVFLKF